MSHIELRKFIITKEISQTDISEATGVNRSGLCQYLKHGVPIAEWNLYAILEYLHINPKPFMTKGKVRPL